MKRKIKTILDGSRAKRAKSSQSERSEYHGNQSERSEYHGNQSERSEYHGNQSERSEYHGNQSERSEYHGNQSERSEYHGNQSERSEHLGNQSERWESDSGFSSGRSSPVSGRSSPLMSVAPVEAQSLARCPPQSAAVSLDCEMVGTGPRGRVSEVARCSVVDYQGNVLFDEYVRPIGHITDYRSQWSGITKHHLTRAIPFSQARDRVQSLLEGKVLVGHSVQTDLKSLDLVHPGHMIRDTSCTRLLTRLAGFPREQRPSLKALTNRLLHRKIQTGRRGHCSVEDAAAALDLYKLVEGEWEREVELSLRDERDPAPPSYASSQHYLKDEYWP